MKRCLFGLLLVFTACSIFPRTGNYRQIITPVQNFSQRGASTIYTPNTLATYLPGQSPVTREYGLDSLLVTDYTRGTETYHIELYSFRQPDGAMGYYTLTGTPQNRLIDLRFRGRTSGGTVSVLKGHFVLTVAPAQGGNASGALELATGLTGKIPGRISTSLFEPFPKDNLIEGSEFYFMGPFSFRQHFGDALAEALAFQTFINGTAVRYQVGQYQVNLLKIRYQTRSDARLAIDSFTNYYRIPSMATNPQMMYTTTVNPDKTESYLFESADILFVMLNAQPDGKGSDLFEYIIRGGR